MSDPTDGQRRVPLPIELAVACLFVALEERIPGLSDRCLELSESDSMATEVRRLHAPAPNPELAAAMQEATGLIRHFRTVALVHGSAKLRKKGKG